MLTLNIQCEVTAERQVILQLPEQVEPGPHELVLVIDSPMVSGDKASNTQALMRLAGSVPAFAAVNGVAFQRTLRDEWP